jgi:hypothetical protein
MTTDEHIQAWFLGRLPGDWFTGPATVTMDRDEIVVVGELTPPALPDDLGPDARAVALATRIRAYREQTREQRIAIAQEAEHRYRRKVAWGARCAEHEELFTTASVPVMTRLRMAERKVLDTLIDGGVARSRSEALAWCVRLVGQNQGEWIEQLRRAMAEVERVRSTGPDAG